MSRTFKIMEIEGKEAYVLFDTGSIRSYVRKGFVSKVSSKVRWSTIPFKVGLGGRLYEVEEACAMNCAIDGLGFAHPVENIGTDERGQRIDAIIGAMGMEKWGLIPPSTGSIDPTALRKREFIEF